MLWVAGQPRGPDILMPRGKNWLPTVPRQFLTRNYPHPNCLFKCLPHCLSPTREGFFFSSFEIAPAVRVIARQLSGKNCLAAIFASRHQDQSRFLGRGCDEALFSERKGFSVKRGEAIQWTRGLVRISTGKAIQWRGSGHSLNRRTPKTEKLLCSSTSQTQRTPTYWKQYA